MLSAGAWPLYFTGNFLVPIYPKTWPLILGHNRSAHKQDIECVEENRNGDSASHSPVDQAVEGSAISFPSPRWGHDGAPAENDFAL